MNYLFGLTETYIIVNQHAINKHSSRRIHQTLTHYGGALALLGTDKLHLLNSNANTTNIVEQRPCKKDA